MEISIKLNASQARTPVPNLAPLIRAIVHAYSKPHAEKSH